MFLARLISSLTVGLLLVSASYAQSPVKQEDPATTPDQQKELEQKALALLEEVVSQASTLKLVENRISIQATAADFMWEYDEKRARSIFKAAVTGLAEVIGALDQSDPQAESLAQTLTQLRLNLLDTITRHDPQMALELLRATRQTPSLQRRSSSSPQDAEIQLEGRLAWLIAAQDPQRALQIARESLSKGLSYELLNTLSQLKSQDKAAAATLSQEIVATLKAENRMTSGVSRMAFSLLHLLKPPEPNEQLFRELLDLLIRAALNAPLSDKITQEEQYLARNMLAQLQMLMPEIEKYAPLRVAALRKKLTELDRVADPSTRSLNEMNRLAQSGTVEEMLAAAAKMPPESRGQGYQQVARKAAGEGEFDRARQIANNEVLEPIQRQGMLEEIDRQALWQVANQGKINEAHQLLAKLHSVEDRVSALIRLAEMVSGKNDPKTARRFLEEALEMVSGRANNYQRIEAQLRVAQAYAQLDPDRGFEIIIPIIEQLNELMAAAAVLDGFENNYLKDGEWASSGGSTLSNMVITCDQQIASLARADFDRAKALADRWQRNEVQVKARLLIVQAVLSNARQIAQSTTNSQK